jgi:hypothetical protein
MHRSSPTPSSECPLDCFMPITRSVYYFTVLLISLRHLNYGIPLNQLCRRHVSLLAFMPNPLTPFPGSASRNRDAILQAITPYIESTSNGRILEISSGSGEHVVAFAERWPDDEFWPSERNEEQLRCARDVCLPDVG